MSRYNKINRILLALCAMGSCYFLALQEYQTALAMAFLLPLSRGILSIADVFFTFFTERPLFPVERPTMAESTSQRISRQELTAGSKGDTVATN